jgi:hypothetical protein
VITIPSGLIIPLFIASAALSSWQLVQIPRASPLNGSQFWVVVFCIVMMLLTIFLGRSDPWLSVALFVVAVATFLFVLRQNRMVPPRKRIE